MNNILLNQLFDNPISSRFHNLINGAICRMGRCPWRHRQSPADSRLIGEPADLERSHARRQRAARACSICSDATPLQALFRFDFASVVRSLLISTSGERHPSKGRVGLATTKNKISGKSRCYQEAAARVECPAFARRCRRTHRAATGSISLSRRRECMKITIRRRNT